MYIAQFVHRLDSKNKKKKVSTRITLFIICIRHELILFAFSV